VARGNYCNHASHRWIAENRHTAEKRNISGDDTWLAGISTQKFEDFPAINLSFEFVGFLPRHVTETHRIFHHYPTMIPLSHHVPIAITRKIT